MVRLPPAALARVATVVAAVTVLHEALFPPCVSMGLQHVSLSLPPWPWLVVQDAHTFSPSPARRPSHSSSSHSVPRIFIIVETARQRSQRLVLELILPRSGSGIGGRSLGPDTTLPSPQRFLACVTTPVFLAGPPQHRSQEHFLPLPESCL